jgi:predicted NBD/HSP70 family sugar kinase
MTSASSRHALLRDRLCLKQIQDGLVVATRHAGVAVESLVSVGLATPGPASAESVLSQRGSTNFVHPEWAAFELRAGLSAQLGKPVSYLNDGNAAALWGHYKICGERAARPLARLSAPDLAAAS